MISITVFLVNTYEKDENKSIFESYKIKIKQIIKFSEETKVYKINIFNLKNFEKKKLMEIIGFKINQNIFMIDLKKIKKKLQNINEIESFKIKRNTDGVLNIYIEEKKPFMFWEFDGKREIIGLNGEVLDYYKVEKKLPLIKGKNANHHIKELYRIIQLNKNVSVNFLYGEYIEEYRWDLYFKDNFHVKLPSKNYSDSLLKLNKFFENKEFKKNYKILDMRVNNRIFLKQIYD